MAPRRDDNPGSRGVRAADLASTLTTKAGQRVRAGLERWKPAAVTAAQAAPAALPAVPCPVCGATSWAHTPVLWPGLVSEWELSVEEAASIDRQQGTHCTTCTASLRGAALARAVLTSAGFPGTLSDWVAAAPDLRVLEINEAATLTPVLSRLPGHEIVRWPDVDIHALPFPDSTVDLVLHSDTLEHVDRPLVALEECLRVLRPGGSLCFTTPVLTGRLTRRRDHLPASYHGLETDPAFLVVSEFGAEAWTLLFDAGFDDLRLLSFQWPDAFSFLARRPSA